MNIIGNVAALQFLPEIIAAKQARDHADRRAEVMARQQELDAERAARAQRWNDMLTQQQAERASAAAVEAGAADHDAAEMHGAYMNVIEYMRGQLERESLGATFTGRLDM